MTVKRPFPGHNSWAGWTLAEYDFESHALFLLIYAWFCSETETNYGNYGWLLNNWTLLNSHLVCVIADVDVG